ncbi:MAG: DUF3021 family protein [Cellulosilyticum sp.]|nr:DUF3021 family protein [Cellulosilyticum sp.]
MTRITEFIYQFCASTTGSLIGMIVTVQIGNPLTNIRVVDLLGLIFANFLIVLLTQIVSGIESTSRLGDRMKYMVHYIGTVIILCFFAHKLEWIQLSNYKVVALFAGIILIIHLAVSGFYELSSRRTSKEINEALISYQQKQIK